ncbi:hypothetical protein GOP47_0023541 [Adiantum capillus-veneris]|uniref:Uncharacterized protein n=1 Tax=Adiantum capillus-veneris TaxID=13818 RepID=A0A9D4U692_ADICA|nr:hypothetical protein GOP47_0023541 [Adiantum capillus-veneris]
MERHARPQGRVMGAPLLSLFIDGEAAAGATRLLSLPDGNPRLSINIILILLINIISTTLSQTCHPRHPHKGDFRNVELLRLQLVEALAMLEAVFSTSCIITTSVTLQIIIAFHPVVVPLVALGHPIGLHGKAMWAILLLHHQILLRGHQISSFPERDICSQGPPLFSIPLDVRESHRHQMLVDLYFTEITVGPILYPRKVQEVFSVDKNQIVECPFRMLP